MYDYVSEYWQGYRQGLTSKRNDMRDNVDRAILNDQIAYVEETANIDKIMKI